MRSAATSGWSTPNAAAIAVAAARRSAIASPTQPVICAAARGQRPRTRKTSSAWAYLLPGARRARAPRDDRRDENAEQQKRDRPARQRPTQRAEREHEREPQRADGADGVAIPPTVQSRLRSAACGKREQSEPPSRSWRAPSRSRPSRCSSGRPHQGATSSRRSASAPISRRLRMSAASRRRPLRRSRSTPRRRPRALRSPRRRGHRAAAESRRARPVRRSSPGTGQGGVFPARGRGASSVNVLRRSSGPAVVIGISPASLP